MFDGMEAGTVFPLDEGGDRDLFDLPIGGISKNDILIEQRVVVVAVGFVKSYINVVVIPSFFKDPCFGSKEGSSEQLSYLRSRNPEFSSFLTIDSELYPGLVFIDINFQFFTPSTLTRFRCSFIFSVV